VANATVEIRNPVSGFDRKATTDPSGRFQFTNVPFNPYHLTVVAEGFADYVQDVESPVLRAGQSVPQASSFRIHDIGDRASRGRRLD